MLGFGRGLGGVGVGGLEVQNGNRGGEGSGAESLRFPLQGSLTSLF